MPSGTYRTCVARASSSAFVLDTLPNEAQVVRLVEYCHVPFPLVLVIAMFGIARVSTSTHDALVAIEPAVVPLDVVSSLVAASVTVAPLEMVGASLTEVIVIDACAAWME